MTINDCNSGDILWLSWTDRFWMYEVVAEDLTYLKLKVFEILNYRSSAGYTGYYPGFLSAEVLESHNARIIYKGTT